jgi:heme exporter protein D
LNPAHLPFIAAAYGITLLVVGGLILRAVLDHRAQMRALAALERRGASGARGRGGRRR